MAFWTRVWGLVTGAGYRQPGLQLGAPASYDTSPAASVTVDSALQLSSVWACVRLITESVASLPVRVYKKEGDGPRSYAEDHPLNQLFENKVNRWQTRTEFFETLTMQLVLSGNGYVMIQRNAKGQIIGLVPLMSAQMEVTLLDDGDLLYQYTDGSNVKVYSSQSIWHIKCMGNGVVGLSPLSYARNSLGLAIAGETRTTKIMSNGAKPAGVLMVDQLLKPDQRQAIRENFKGLTAGEDDRLFVLEANMKYQQVSMAPKDIELLESRRFQTEDIARFFGVPSVLINDTGGTTAWGSGIYQIVQGFYKLGLRPYLERYESSMKAWLLPMKDRRNYEIEFEFNSLLRADMVERFKSYKEGIMGGFMTPNQARADEGWQPKEGGDELFMQQQMVPVALLKDGPTQFKRS